MAGAKNKKQLLPDIQRIKFWKRHNPDSDLDVTLIECSAGWQMLDEADASGNGVLTLYTEPSKAGKSMKCYSLVKRSSTIYNRKDYQRLKTDCLTKFSIIKEDFEKEGAKVIHLSRLPRPGFEGILDYLKQVQIIRQ